MTSLFSLAEGEKWEDVKSLLEKEPHKINEKGKFSRTLAFPAIEQKNLAILKYLAIKGLDFKILDRDGCSVLHEAARQDSVEIAKYLVEVQKLNTDFQDNFGWTALHIAASRGNIANVKYLVTAGASMELKNKASKTAADYAKKKGYLEVYEYLVTAEQQTSSKAATNLERLEVQLNEAMRRIEEGMKEKKALETKHETEMEQTLSLLKQAQIQVAASKAYQLEYALAIIPAQHLKVIKVLGKGATAEVSLVTWQAKQYAYKRFHDVETAASCIKEASVAMSLACPYIIHVFGKTEKPAGMLVEYMNKGSLFTVLFKSKLTLSPSQKKQIALAVGNALVLMHDRGILHRDIKPDNVLIHGSEDNSELYAKVADFGTAKSLSTRMTAATTGAAFIGTLNFMAPELLNSAMAQMQAEIMGISSTTPPVAATKECDMYSFGVLLYELICEKQAYQGMFFPSPIQFMKHVISGKRPEIPNTCSAGWKALIDKCWCEDPKQRPSIKEVLGALEKM